MTQSIWIDWLDWRTLTRPMGFSRRCEMAPARKRLSIVENTTPGFFDPVTLAREIHLVLKGPKSGEAHTERKAASAFAKARSNRVNRAAKIVVQEFMAKHPHIPQSTLERQTTKNHPKCLHACLLGAMVAGLYPDGGVYVQDEDAAWIASRSPDLPTPHVKPGSPTDNGSGLEDDVGTASSSCHVVVSNDASDEAEYRIGLGSINDEPSSDEHAVPTSINGAMITRNPSDDAVVRPNLRWYTDATVENVRDDFPSGEPWSSSARHRLIKCALPHGVTLTIDPLTGLVRASDITKYFEKRVTRWLDLGNRSNDDEGTRGLAYSLASGLGTTPSKLVYVIPVTSSDGIAPCTWIHIQMVVHLACWCSAPFSVHVSKLVLQYHSGNLTTEESRSAAQLVHESMRSEARDARNETRSAHVPASSSQHRLVRTRARQSSIRVHEIRDVPIPRHLTTTTGVYVGVWGSVEEDGGDPWGHLKIGKASEQSVTARIKDHYAEKPYTFVLMFIAGCDGGQCHIAEAAMKHFAIRVLGLERVGNSDEEFKVPMPDLESTVAKITSDLIRRHGDLLTQADDVSQGTDLEKFRIQQDTEVKKYALDQILKISDIQARERAIAMVLGVNCAS